MQASERPTLQWLLPEALEGSPQLCASLCSSAEFHKLEVSGPTTGLAATPPYGMLPENHCGPSLPAGGQADAVPTTGADAAGERATIHRQAGRQTSGR